MFKKIINFLSLKKKFFFSKKLVILNGVDLIIDYFFKEKNDGIYVDVGAQNPVSNNNTFLLHKGWRGLNIDLDEENIELFRSARPKDYNFNFAISSKEENKKLFFIILNQKNTLEENVSKAQKAKFQK